MGKGGQQQPPAFTSLAPKHKEQWTSPYNPCDPKAPKLPTKGEIKTAIPKECFERSYTQGLWHILLDFGSAALCVFAAKAFLSAHPPSTIWSVECFSWIVGWNAYAFCMGSSMAGLWVLAHECGHGSLFPSTNWNNFFGFFIHQSLLTPYFPWRYTHSKHHQYTNHMQRDTVYVPQTLSEVVGIGKIPKESEHCSSSLSLLALTLRGVGNGPVSLFNMAFYMLVGWPLYLFGGSSILISRTNHDGSPNNGERLDHFNPNSKFLPPKLWSRTFLSTITCAATICFLAKMSFDRSILHVALWYVFPTLWLSFWLITYTFLHHTDPSVPVYGEDEWTWMKGALTTIDRDYGIFNFLHHHIGSTHVVHHMFHEIPFYNAVKATRAVRDHLEPRGLYNFDPTPWWKALWRAFRECQYVDTTCGVQYRKSLDGVVPLLRNRKGR